MRDDLLLCISIPLKCGPQAPTVAFGMACRLCTGRPRGCGAYSSKHESESSNHTVVEPQREEWWKSTWWQCATVMPQTSHRARLLEEECHGLITKWFERIVETCGGVRDFIKTGVLQWWQRYQHKYLEIADLARRRLFAQASSATSERAFLEAGLVISKKRQRLTSDHVDGITCWDAITKTMVGENHQRDSVVFRRWKDKDLKRKAKWQHSRASKREVAFSKLM